MTAPNGPILFNSSTGSDTAASGLGPDPAQTGSGASTTAASAVVTGITTTGVNAGDLLWVQSSSGRQFAIIASVDSGTQVTCDDTFDNTETGRTWAIGGKRATLLATKELLVDAKGGWVIELADGHAEDFAGDYIDLVASGNETDGQIVLRGESNATTLPSLTTDSDVATLLISGDGWGVTDMKVTNTRGAQNPNVLRDNGGDSFLGKRLIIEASASLCCRLGTYHRLSQCRIVNKLNSFTGVTLLSYSQLDRCWIEGFGNEGIIVGGNGDFQSVTDSAIINCGNGITAAVGNGDGRLIAGNIIYNSSGDGIEIGGADRPRETRYIYKNIIALSGGVGINYIPLGVTANKWAMRNAFAEQNAFWANTGGNLVNIPDIDNHQLTADPFVDAAAGDFNLNNDPGGGALLRAATVVLP